MLPSSPGHERRRRRVQLLAIAGFATVVLIAAIAVSQAGGIDEGDAAADAAAGALFAGIPQSGTARPARTAR